MTETATSLQSIQSAKARIRLDEQRKGFDTMLVAIQRAGFKSAAFEFRKAADAAMERSEAFYAERDAFERDRATLEGIRAVLDQAGAPTAMHDKRSLTDVERVEAVVLQWRAMLCEFAVKKPTE